MSQNPQFVQVDLGTDEFRALMQNFKDAFNKVMVSPQKPTFTQQLKADGENAAYRVAAQQLMNAGQNLILIQLQKSDSSRMHEFKDFLQTEFGRALLEMVVGSALSQLSLTNKSPKLTRLLKEFRVSGMTTTGNLIFESVIQAILPVLNEAFSEKEAFELEEEIVSEEKLLQSSI